MQDHVTRKSSPPIKVYCLPDERAAVRAKADAAGLSLSAYLLRGYLAAKKRARSYTT